MHNTELVVEGLDVFYGRAHAVQGVSLRLGDGVLAVVGRNGMGKSSLCKALTGMVPESGSVKGSVRLNGEELLGRSPHVITRLGVAYVPQGRRVWRSLTVDETLQLSVRTARQGAWTVERVYAVFPRLAERRSHGGAQLSGGEQQMLAIGRALLFNPRLIVMDEPTEGLAPVIVEQVATLLKTLAKDRSMSVLLIEQNLCVALEVADQVSIMVNGRIAHHLPAAELAADRALQQRLLGLKAGAADAEAQGDRAETGSATGATTGADTAPRVLRVVRAHGTTPRPEEPAAPPVPTASPRHGSHHAHKPLVCITSLGIASDAVRHTRRALDRAFDCLVLDMAAGGGPSLARLVASSLVAGIVDIAPADVARAVITGQDDAARQRFAALAASGIPYVLLPTLLTRAVFPPGQAVPGHLQRREQTGSAQDGAVVGVTAEEARRIGEWLGAQLAGFEGPVGLLTLRESGDAAQAAQAALLAPLLHRFRSRPDRPHPREDITTDCALADPRLGEALGAALRGLIQRRLAA